MSMVFNDKIVVVLEDDLAVWQKLNVTAFLVSGLAATIERVTGEPFRDGSGNEYYPMFRQPVMVYATSGDKLRTVSDRVRSREVRCALFTRELFATNNDIDNRAAMAAVPRGDLDVVGIAFRAENKVADKILKGVSLHS